MKTIGIALNPGKDPDLIFTRRVIEHLARQNCRLLLTLPPRRGPEWAGVEFCALPDLKICDVILVLGGDGTILSTAGLAAKCRIPVLGLNLGTVGFMAELEKEELSLLDRLFTGDYFLEDRMMLQTHISGREEPLYSLNECCLSLYHGLHILTLELYQGEEKLCELKADGVIFSTPTGSTGYSFSAGGAVVDSRLESIGVTAICPYLPANSHHLLFSPDTVLQVKNIQAQNGPLFLSSDGREEVSLDPGATLTVSRSPRGLKLVRFRERTNIQAFFRKF